MVRRFLIVALAPGFFGTKLVLRFYKKTNIMGFIRTLVIGAAVTYGIKQLTKTREDGSSILSDFMDKAPGYAEKARDFASTTVDRVTQTVKDKTAF